VGFSGDARSLQVNVDAAYGGGGDKVRPNPTPDTCDRTCSTSTAGLASDSPQLLENAVPLDWAHACLTRACRHPSQPASATDKSTGAAQDLSDQTQGPKTDASGDAKTVDAAKRVRHLEPR
jgi:hypothetical protein